MSHFIRRSIPLLAALLFCSQLHAEKLLRWKFAEGDQWKVRITQVSKTDTRAGIRPVKMTIDMSMDMDWSIQSVKDDTATITQRFTRIALKMTPSDGKAVEFDSSSESKRTGISKAIGESVAPLLDVDFFLTVNNRGEFVEVSLSDEAKKKLDSIPKDSNLKSIFTQEGITDLLQQSAVVLPKDAINEGDEWKTKTTAKTPIGELTQNHTYTYVGSNQGDEEGAPAVEKITVTSTLDLKAPKTSGSKITIKEHTQTGQLLFDADAGRFVETSISQKIVSELPYRNLNIKSTVETSLKMTIVDSSEN